MELARLRIGIGHDTHRLAEGGPLILGGLTIDFPYHLEGHSDADVLLHAVTDAVLGAAGMGDIGEQFPDTDPVNRDRDSIEMLTSVVGRVRQQGFELINLDCIVFAERPKLSTYKRPMAERIGGAIELPWQRINIKAKTGERTGAVGAGQVMMAQCVALMMAPADAP